MAGCLVAPVGMAADSLLTGGATTVFDSSRRAFSLPLANLAITRRGDFFIGNSFATSPWVVAPASTKARDGLGPVYNANSCQSCHVRDGRGSPPEAGDLPLGLLVKISVPPKAVPTAAEQRLLQTQGVIPEPHYGAQLASRAVPGVMAEPLPQIQYRHKSGRFADGETYVLREPVMTFAYEPQQPQLDARVQTSARLAPAMIGMGLLQAIPAEQIMAAADPDDADGDGISGRANQVWDVVSQQTTLGRFGWKAANPTVRQQVAAAFVNDMGITSPLFPQQPCTAEQADCQAAYHDAEPEVSAEILDFVSFYSMSLAVPARRDVDAPQVVAGEKLFQQAACGGCHTPQQTTAKLAELPEVGQQVIWPYTDLLLHDMGEGLADGRAEFAASGREWRTPPLWGLGLLSEVNGYHYFLHDGRARNLMEAILWHDGEARAARDKVLQMSGTERAALLAFLNSL